MNALTLSTVLVLAVGLAFALTLASAAPAGEGDEPAKVEVGAPAPTFRLNDHEGSAVALGGGKDHGWFVLAFYPKAMTPGCTKEVCSLRDSLGDLQALGVKVYGISLDDVVSQRKFFEEQKLNFPLLSDPDGSVAAKYQVLLPGAAWTQRFTFVVDPQGILRHVDTKVNVLGHGADLEKVIRGLQAK